MYHVLRVSKIALARLNMRGSSLVEALIAASVLTVFVVGMTTAQGKLYQLDSVASERTQAAQLLSSHVEEVATRASADETGWDSVASEPLSYPVMLDGNGLPLEVRDYCYQLEVFDVNDDLKRLTAEIFYQEPGGLEPTIDGSGSAGRNNGEPIYRIRTILLKGGPAD